MSGPFPDEEIPFSPFDVGSCPRYWGTWVMTRGYGTTPYRSLDRFRSVSRCLESAVPPLPVLTTLSGRVSGTKSTSVHGWYSGRDSLCPVIGRRLFSFLYPSPGRTPRPSRFSTYTSFLLSFRETGWGVQCRRGCPLRTSDRQ